MKLTNKLSYTIKIMKIYDIEKKEIRDNDLKINVIINDKNFNLERK